MSDVISNLYKTLDYMAKSDEFNESSSVLFVYEAIKEIESLQADAQRYRWIKNIKSDTHIMFESYNLSTGYADLMTAKVGQSLDQAIDEAMKG